MKLDLTTAVEYHYGKFPPKDLDHARFLQELLAATDAVARYDQMLKGLPNTEIFLAPLRSQEAVISSRIEGTISTMDEILRYEADAEEEEDGEHIHVRPDIIETVLYQRSLKSAQAALKDGYPLSTSFIKQLHQQLLSHGRGARKSPGQFKVEQNYLADPARGKVTFIPIRPEKLDEGLTRLMEYVKSSSDPALVKTAVMHVEFEALHPFKDGNGRIGRMLVTLLLWHLGVLSAPHFYISGYFEEHKDEYLASLREVSRSNDWSSWCRFFLEAVEKEAKRNLKVAEEVRDLYEKMKAIFSEKLSSRYSVTALDFIFTNPLFRNSRFTAKSGIPAATAGRFTRLLSEEGLLLTLEEAAGRRAALYSFEPLMELVRV